MSTDDAFKAGHDACGDGALPEGAGPARLIVCERTGRWAVALRQALGDAGVYVHQTRSLPETWDMLARCPASFVVAEWNRATMEPLLARVAWLDRDFPLARVAIVAERSWQAHEWLMREAGAIHVVVSPRELATLAQAIGVHLEKSPRPRLGPAEQIWADLPWGRRT